MKKPFRRRVGRAAGLALIAASASITPIGCSSSEELGGAGAMCIQVTDCRLGLVCVPVAGGASACSADAAALEYTEEAGPLTDGVAPPSEASPNPEGSGDGTSSSDEAPVEAAAVQDASVSEASAPVPDGAAGRDASSTADASVPLADAAGAASDAAPPAVEASPPADASVDDGSPSGGADGADSAGAD
ncbi:MAG: hypothetical protein ABSC94_18950 [Polyangiaceae bacterium]